jgi:hypothetical protein
VIRAIARTAAIIALVAMLVSLAGCGGGGGGSSTPVMPVQNVQPIVVDTGPANSLNLVFVTLTICSPGSTSACQTIDHVQIDTGSSGLRIISSVLSPTLSLPQRTDNAGNPLGECVQFADGSSWGSVRGADVQIAGEKASAIAVHVIGDPLFAPEPASCSSSGPPENTVPAFGANGLLGISEFIQDCGSACANNAFPGAYYICPSTGCVPTTVSLASQVSNPVAMFASDNNGAIIDLPSVPATGALTVNGSLIFGIGTQANNGLGSAAVFALDPNKGTLTTVLNGVALPNSFFDAGSNGIFFGTNTYPACAAAGVGFYCPATAQNVTATIRGTNGVAANITFSVANADQLFAANPSFVAFSNLTGPGFDPTALDWGLPVFYGRRVYTAIEGRSTPGGTGPFVAF